MRSRPATRITKTTVASLGDDTAGPPPSPVSEMPAKAYTDAEAVACSLENPESCEACT